MLESLKQNKFIFSFVWMIRRIFGITPEKKNYDFHINRREGLIKEYFSTAKSKKLQIGAQSNSVEGWLNVDIEPKDNHVVLMDATVKFPFDDQAFDYVFSEHMIEHITYEQADFMLSEIFRITKDNGVIRIVTPDLKQLARVVLDPEKEEHKSYIKHYRDRFFDESYPLSSSLLVNKLFYSFHHRHIHTFESLENLLVKNGFTAVKQMEVSHSEISELNNLEQHWRELGVENNIMESIVVEAVKKK